MAHHIFLNRETVEEHREFEALNRELICSRDLAWIRSLRSSDWYSSLRHKEVAIWRLLVLDFHWTHWIFAEHTEFSLNTLYFHCILWIFTEHTEFLLHFRWLHWMFTECSLNVHYIVDFWQRCGIGLNLFKAFLDNEHCEPRKLAWVSLPRNPPPSASKIHAQSVTQLSHFTRDMHRALHKCRPHAQSVTQVSPLCT
jgi:hypothetical protein